MWICKSLAGRKEGETVSAQLAWVCCVGILGVTLVLCYLIEALHRRFQ
jgi:hypothetical protein